MCVLPESLPNPAESRSEFVTITYPAGPFSRRSRQARCELEQCTRGRAFPGHTHFFCRARVSRVSSAPPLEVGHSRRFLSDPAEPQAVECSWGNPGDTARPAWCLIMMWGVCMNSKRALLILGISAIFVLASCSGQKSSVCTVNCGGGSGTATLTIMLRATPLTPTASTNLLAFVTTVTGVSLTPSSGNPVNLSNTPTLDFVHLQ